MMMSASRYEGGVYRRTWIGRLCGGELADLGALASVRAVIALTVRRVCACGLY
jgi:hypothetical protein